jgi:hypothetical protein
MKRNSLLACAAATARDHRLLSMRYERNAQPLPGLHHLRSHITCYKKLAKLTI